MGKITYLVVNGVFRFGGKTYSPGCVFAADSDELAELKGLGISLWPYKNGNTGRRLLKPGESIMELPERTLENIKTESLMIAYHQETRIPFDEVKKFSREYLLEEIMYRRRRWHTAQATT
jgi:hypothetical protein